MDDSPNSSNFFLCQIFTLYNMCVHVNQIGCSFAQWKLHTYVCTLQVSYIICMDCIHNEFALTISYIDFAINQYTDRIGQYTGNIVTPRY